MRFIKIYLHIICIIIFSACSENIIENKNSSNNYKKIISAEDGIYKFELWADNRDTLMTGYNLVGFKVFENNIQKNTGFVKFNAKMFHFSSTDFHATPVEPFYYYNSSLQMFTGYVIMLMPSDTASFWYGYFNYYDKFRIDSVNFNVGWEKRTKFKIFTHLSTSKSYLITVVSPLNPVLGFNEFKCLLHESPDFIDFTQVNTAQMHLRVRLDSLNHTSNGNEDPLYIGGGIYKGKLNFDYIGGWKVYDSIYYNNLLITENGTPYIYFDVK